MWGGGVKVQQSRYRPRGFQEVKVPRFHDNGTGWWYGCQPYAPATFTPRKCSWYSFLLKAKLTPGPQCDQKDFMSKKNVNDTSWDRTSDLPRFVAQHLNRCATAVPMWWGRNWLLPIIFQHILNQVHCLPSSCPLVSYTLELLPPPSDLLFSPEMKAAFSSETLIISCYIPEDSHLNGHYCETISMYCW